MSQLHSDPVAVRLVREVIQAECIVCDSILCRSNWKVHQTLVGVRDEVVRGLALKLRYADRLLLWMLFERLKTKLPTEMFRAIESFL